MTGYPATCCMPTCPLPAVVRNRAGQGTCAHHRLVVVTGTYDMPAAPREDAL